MEQNPSNNHFNKIFASRFSFDNFIVADCNCVARLAASIVCANPIIKPLVITGSTGLGKTHLAKAIRLELKKQFPEKKCLYITATEFTSQYVNAIKTNKKKEFLNLFYFLEVLIIDDIQHFQNREKTQEILISILDHFLHFHKQIIVTSNVSLIESLGFDERLLSRLNSGLTVVLEKPDTETRFKILKSFCNYNHIDINDEVLSFVANIHDIDIRVMEGFLATIIANSVLQNKKITLELARTTYNKLKDFNSGENNNFRYFDFLNKEVGNF